MTVERMKQLLDLGYRIWRGFEAGQHVETFGRDHKGDCHSYTKHGAYRMSEREVDAGLNLTRSIYRPTQ